jgi:hypothetical protein
MEAAAVGLENACQAAENAGSDIPFSLRVPLHIFIDRHEALITAIGVVLARHSGFHPSYQTSRKVRRDLRLNCAICWSD